MISLQKSYSLLFIFTFYFSACDKALEDTNSIEGQWQSIGYGRVLDIQSDIYSLYDITRISCLPIRQRSVSEFEGNIKLVNDTLSIKEGFDIYYY